MKKEIFVILCVFVFVSYFNSPLFCQNVKGKWTGYLEHTTDTVNTYYVELDLIQIGKEIKGTYRCFNDLDMEHIAKFEIKGKFKKGKLKFLTKKLLQENGIDKDNIIFCFNYSRLIHYTENGEEFLEGDWTGTSNDEGNCGNAYLILRREEEIQNDKNNDDRDVIIKETITVRNNKIVLEIWDANKVDGDVISLKMNDKLLLEEFEVKKERKEIKVELDRNSNLIILYSVNEGSIPPNTAAVNIKYDDKTLRMVLNSDTRKSEAIRVILKE